LRDFQGFIDRGGIGGAIGTRLLDDARAMFHLWHRVPDKSLARTTFQRRLQPVEQRILRLLRKAALRAEPRTAGMAREILS
jgi:transposase